MFIIIQSSMVPKISIILLLFLITLPRQVFGTQKNPVIERDSFEHP